MQKEHLVPASILIGCAIIGAGLYFGLRAQAPAAQGPTPAGTSGSSVATAPSGSRGDPPPMVTAVTAPPAPMMPGLGPPAVSPALQASVEKAAAEALAAEKKSALVPRCWQPALQRAPQPAAAKYTLDITFDGQGNQIAFGISEDRSALRSDVVPCLNSMSLHVAPPPGIPVRVLLPLEFP